jgi:hypothetical protein
LFSPDFFQLDQLPGGGSGQSLAFDPPRTVRLSLREITKYGPTS